MLKRAFQLGVKLAVEEGGPSEEEARSIGEQIGIDWDSADFPVEELRMGIGVEYEHGSRLGANTDVTKDDPLNTARIAWAHLKEISDYYTRLKQMEEEGKAAMGKEANGDEEEESPGKPVDMGKVVSFLKQNPNPSDDAVHDFAEEQGYNVHKLEGYIYRLATQAAKGA